MAERWIKSYARLLEWEWFDDAEMVRFWLYLLHSANYESNSWRGVVAKRGQLVTSLSKLAGSLNRSVRNIRTYLERLQSTGEIVCETTNKYTLITICNYELYQSSEKVSRQSADKQPTRRTTSKSTSETTSKVTSKNDESNKSQSDDYGDSELQERQAERQAERHTIRNQDDEKPTSLYISEYRNKNNIYNISSKEDKSTSDELDPSNQKPEDEIKLVVDFFNKTVEESGAVFPKVRGATGKRVGYIRARIREYGIGSVYEVITKASTSDFLNGKNSRGWTATFDWIFLPTNFQKVLEGNYDNRPIQNIQINGNNRTSSFQEQRAAELNQLAGDYSAIIARRLAEDEARR